MKLWQVIQWGNIEDGGNGPDTQCIISAPDLQSAVREGEARLYNYHSFSDKGWKDDADVVYLLGEDHRPDGEAVVIVPVWVQNAFNMAGNPSWHRDYESKVWKTREEMYGPEKT